MTVAYAITGAALHAATAPQTHHSVATKISVIVVSVLLAAFTLWVMAKMMQGNLQAYRAGRAYEKEQLAKARMKQRI